MQLIQKLINPRYGIPVLIVFLFKARKSMHILIVPSFFFTKTTDEANGLELGLMQPYAIR
jgi:hypothetical protein